MLSDLTDWQRAPLPVAALEAFELPDDARSVQELNEIFDAIVPR